jgi:hypothetical protein
MFDQFFGQGSRSIKIAATPANIELRVVFVCPTESGMTFNQGIGPRTILRIAVRRPISAPTRRIGS